MMKMICQICYINIGAGILKIEVQGGYDYKACCISCKMIASYQVKNEKK